MANKTIWLVGYHAIDALLRTNPERAIELLIVENVNNTAQKSIVELARGHQLAISVTDKLSLNKRSGTDQNQGVALIARPKPEPREADLEGFIERLDCPLLLILDQVKDPHNLI